MRHFALLALSLILSIVPTLPIPRAAAATEYFAAPTGLPTNTGSLNSPWDISTALVKLRTAAPGTTLYLREGTYKSPCVLPVCNGFPIIDITGSAEAPITIRPYENEHAIIDGGLDIAHSSGDTVSYLDIIGLEIHVSESKPRDFSNLTHKHGDSKTWPSGGISLTYTNRVRFINNVVHDTGGDGIAAWKESKDAEFYGNILYNNGFLDYTLDSSGNKKTDSHGPCLYMQNQAPSYRYLSDNIMAGCYTRELQVYGSGTAPLHNFSITGNTIFFPPGWNAFLAKEGIIRVVGDAGVVAKGLVFKDNVIHGNGNTMPFWFGIASTVNEDAVFTGNTLMDTTLYFNTTTATTNGSHWKSVNGITSSRNAQWTSITGNNTIYTKGATLPARTPLVTLRPNKYDEKRANLSIVRFSGTGSTVAVDPSSFLKAGDSYRLMDPLNLWGTPKLSGTYSGSGTINAPITNNFAAYVLFREPTPTAPAPTLTTTLTAVPTSGTAPLNVNLSASVSGTATGNISYTFYCNRNDSNTTITTPASAQFSNVSSTTQAASCQYTTPGIYTAKVVVQRNGIAAEARQTITVVAPPAPADIRLTLTADKTAAAPGDTILYTATYENIGGVAATNVVIRFPVPEGTHVTSYPTECTITATTVSCPVGTVEAGVSPQSLVFSVQAD